MKQTRRKWWNLGLTFAMALSIYLPSQGVSLSAAADEMIFEDELLSTYANYSWAEVALAVSDEVYQGEYAIRLEPDFEKALYFYRDRVLNTADFESFEMWIHGGTVGGQQAKVVFQAGGQVQSEWKFQELLSEGIPAGEWVKVSIPAKDISPEQGVVDTIIVWDTSGTDQGALYIDQLGFVGAAPSSDSSNDVPQTGSEPTDQAGEETPQTPGPINPIEDIDGIPVYQDQLLSTFQDFGWAIHSLEEPYTVHTGERSISMQPDFGGAIYLYSDRAISSKEYESFEMWVHGGDKGAQQLKLSFLSGGQPIKDFLLDDLLKGTIPAHDWVKVELPLDDVGLNETSVFDAIVISDASNTDQAAVYLDDIVLEAKKVTPPATIELRMDKHQLVLLPDEEKKLIAEAFYADGTSEDVSTEVEWVSDHPEVVKVQNGQLQGVANGVAKVTASMGNYRATAYVQVTNLEEVPVYSEGLETGFSNWSWHEKEMESKEVSQEGEKSIKFFPSGWDGVWIQGTEERKAGDYYGVEFWIHGGDTGGQELLIHLYDGYSNAGNVKLNNYLPNGRLLANTWHHVRINVADFGLTDNPFSGIVFQAATSENQPAVFIDDIIILKNVNQGQLPQPELSSVDIQINEEKNHQEISPDIYGINYHDTRPITSTLPFPVERWGGNNTTRYNWKEDVANRASDWYFLNIPYENEESSEADKMINRVTNQGGKVLLTIPTIGWTPKDREVRWGFSVKQYGSQQSTAAVDGYADAGNGVLSDGSLVTGNDPEETSMKIGPEFVTEWMDHLQKNGDKVNFYALDNEPEIWHVTHRDVHPQAPTYDELWKMTESYGAAIKKKDPDAQIFGPVSWGWCGYFYSSADNCTDGPDRQAHGGAPFLEWYLKQLKNYEKMNEGIKLVDYLDIHYYPQENGIPTEDESSHVAKRRFHSLKTLYDPNFVDQSWIQEPIRLIPRMKELIDQHNPGMKLAITEYNFGNSNEITSALAQAEALAIFGREGVDLATRFGALEPNTPMEDAFKFYLNYDGKGSKIEGTSVQSISSNIDAVGAYAIEGKNRELYVLLFNKDVVPRNAIIKGISKLDSEVEAYRFTSEERLQSINLPLSVDNGSLQAALPARSATLLVFK